MPAEEGDGTGGGDAKGNAVSAGKVAAARDRTPLSVATPVMSAHLLPVLLAFLGATTPVMGYDAYNACAKPGRASRLLADPPCDFRQQAWCTVPGSAYPWQAVRRFVRENQGLMRRMYGDERAAELMRAQLESNEVAPPPNPAPHVWRERALQRYSARRPQEAPPSPPPTASSTEASSTSTSSASTVPTATTQPPTTEPTPPPSVTEMESLRAAEPLADGEGNVTTTPIPSTLDDSTWLTEGTETEPDEATTMAESQLFQAAEEDDADNDQDDEEEEEEEEAPEPEKTPAPQVKLKGVNACPVKEEVVAPFWANNTRGEILALLNVYPFEQYVHWEKCTFEHKQMFCREGCRCEQQYRLHRLLAYDPSNECRGIFSDWFKFPSCCVCRCYDLPVAFHVASRSPRAPAWFRGKLRMRNDDHQ